MEELDPRLAGTADYLRKIVAQLASIVSRLDPETTYEACARADDERNKRLAKIEAQMQTKESAAQAYKDIASCFHEVNVVFDKKNERLDALDKRIEEINAQLEWHRTTITGHTHIVNTLQDAVIHLADHLIALEKGRSK